MHLRRTAANMPGDGNGGVRFASHMVKHVAAVMHAHAFVQTRRPVCHGACAPTWHTSIFSFSPLNCISSSLKQSMPAADRSVAFLPLAIADSVHVGKQQRTCTHIGMTPCML